MVHLSKIWKLFGLIIPLLALLGISTYVVLQNQDIRNKATTKKEFLQVIQAKLLKHRWALVRVVVNDLQSQLMYRVVINVTYSPNPAFPPPPGTNPPPDRKRTMRIKDNKTYPFLFRLQSCYFIPNISAKLYSRVRGKKYTEIPFDGNITTTALTPPCSVTTVHPSIKPEESSESASQPPAAAIEVTNGDIPDDAGEESTDSQAVDIEAIEDIGALEKESNDAVQETSVQTLILPTTNQTALSTPTIQSTIAQAPATIAPTPTSIQPFDVSQGKPTSVQPTSPAGSVQLPFPTAIPTIHPTTIEPFDESQGKPSPTPTTQSLALLIPTPTPSQQVTFGSLVVTQPTNAPNLISLIPTPTSFSPAPLADFAGRSYAETNATPTPFPVFYPAGTVKPTIPEQNPFVPAMPETESPSESQSFSLLYWLRIIFEGTIQFFQYLFEIVKNAVSPNSS